jgi:hypothetical protein
LLRSAGKVIDPAAQALKTAVTGDPTPISNSANTNATPKAVTTPTPAKPAPSNIATPSQSATGTTAVAPEPVKSESQLRAELSGGLKTLAENADARKTFNRLQETKGNPVRIGTETTADGRTIPLFSGNGGGSGNKMYTAADGTPTDDWTKTAAYAEGVKRAEKDIYDAAVLDIGEAARTRSGAEGEAQKQAAIARVNLGANGWSARQKRAQEAGAAQQAMDAGKLQLATANLSLKQQQRLQSLYDAYDKATPEQKAALADETRVLTGKDKQADFEFVAIPGGTDAMGNKLPSALGVGNKKTGQAQVITGNTGQPQKFEVGKVYRDAQGNKAAFKGYDPKGNPIFG